MNQDKNEAAQEFMEEIVDDLGYTPRGGKNQGSGPNVEQGPVPKHLLRAGVGIVLIIVVVAFFLMGRNGDHTEELAAIQDGLTRLEERMARLDDFDKLEERVALLEKEGKRLQQEFRRIRGQKTASSGKRTVSAQKRYHTVRSGESLYTIAKKYGISTDTLCRINKITPKKPIQPGQKLRVTEQR